MPFCTHCGNEVLGGDRFCRRCGGAQPGTSTPQGPPALSPRGASILCYVPWLGWIASIYVLASGRFRDERTVRFHAFQGLYIFVGWMLMHWGVRLWFQLLLGGGHGLPQLIELGLLALWILMLVKTSQGERYSLPVFGELAERSL